MTRPRRRTAKSPARPGLKPGRADRRGGRRRRLDQPAPIAVASVAGNADAPASEPSKPAAPIRTSPASVDTAATAADAVKTDGVVHRLNKSKNDVVLHHATNGQAAAARIKEQYEKAAKERMESGKKPDPRANVPEGRARDQAGKALGVSGRSVDYASSPPDPRGQAMANKQVKQLDPSAAVAPTSAPTADAPDMDPGQPAAEIPVSPGPAPIPAIPPPEQLCPIGRVKWAEILPILLARGELDGGTLDALTAYCTAWATWTKAEAMVRQLGPVIRSAAGFAQPSPYGAVAIAANRQLRQWAGELGLTPATRAKVKDKAKAKQEPAKPQPQPSNGSSLLDQLMGRQFTAAAALTRSPGRSDN